MKKLLILLIIIVTLATVLAINQITMTKTEPEKKEISLNSREAIFAGGCFWCNEAAFEEINGVSEVISGYTGGEEENPTYEQVVTGTTGHREAVKVFYNPEIISYKELVDRFWRQIDPVDDQGQFVDKGPQYTTAIFYQNEEERLIAEQSKAEVAEQFEEPIVTKILPATQFYEAEEYHQDYYKKKTLQYKIYRKGSGRDRLEDIWGEENR